MPRKRTPDRCGELVGRWGDRGECARPKGHRGVHHSLASVRKMQDQVAERYRARRAELDSIKLRAGCIDCGYRLDARALDFDHRDPELKVAGIPQLILLDWETVLREIAKCDIRCANCHRIRTFRG